MPLTDLAKAELEALDAGNRLSEWKARKLAKWAKKNPEQAARNAEAKAQVVADRSTAYATSPEHGELFDLEAREHSMTVTTDIERLRYLRRKLTPVFGAVDFDGRAA